MKGKKYLLIAAVAAAGIFLDQITKMMVVSSIAKDENITIIRGFFDLTLRLNPGAAFSLFTTKPTIFFLVVSLVALTALVYFIRQTEWTQKGQLVSLGLILSGALGNLVDRVRMGSVVDFLLLYYKKFSWPAFNVADSLIVVGVFIFLWYNLRQEALSKKKAA
jgi:signal peptidase II